MSNMYQILSCLLARVFHMHLVVVSEGKGELVGAVRVKLLEDHFGGERLEEWLVHIQSHILQQSTPMAHTLCTQR